MPANCVAPIKARVMRLIKLDECGVPVSGTGSAVITFGGFISIAYSPQYEEGTEFLQKTANGDLCVNQKDPNELKRVTLTVTLCTMDPDMITVVSGERLLTTGSATGTGVAFGEGTLTGRYSMEVWQPVAGAGACSTDGQQQFVYWLFGNVGNTMVGDFTMEQGVFTFTFTSETQGMFTGWPDDIGSLTTGLGGNTIETGEHFLYNVTTTAPPTASCGAVAL